MRDFIGRLGVMGELLHFLWKRKLYWMIPMVATLLIFALLILATGNPLVAPFLYPVF